MPTRLLHDSYITSPSMRICSPLAQDLFPRFLLLPDDFGCVEVEPRVLLGRGWPYRPDITEEIIRACLVEYARAGMLRVWEANGRWFGFFTGWFGEHGQRKRTEYSHQNPKGSKRKTPPPPPLGTKIEVFEASCLPVDFPRGKMAASSMQRPLQERVPIPETPIETEGNAFPPGKSGFPPTQSQSQSQSQSQTQTHKEPVDPSGRPRPSAPPTLFKTPPPADNRPASISNAPGQIKSPHQAFIAWWMNRWTALFGTKYAFTGKDAKLVQEMLKAAEPAEVQRRAEAYLTTDDPWVVEHGRDVAGFRGQFNKLASAGVKPIAAPSATPSRYGREGA